MGVASYTLSTKCSADHKQSKIKIHFLCINLIQNVQSIVTAQIWFSFSSSIYKKNTNLQQNQSPVMYKTRQDFSSLYFTYLKIWTEKKEGGQKGFTYVSLAMIFLPMAAWMAISNNCLGIVSFKRSHRSLPAACALSLKKKVSNIKNISIDQTV